MKYIFLLLITVCFCINSVNAQYDMETQVPLDPTVRKGVLKNGLTYYIKHNEEPKERASFYMIQNVGAILETDEQNGLAHFLEHMAFNGTEHFIGKGIINTLQKHGVEFGRSINAYTGTDETVYNLTNVPLTSDGLLDTCLLILNDWSNYLLLTEEEIDAERGVIAEEWRTRRSAGFRTMKQFMPALVNNSKYADRDVIGSLDVIKNFKYPVIRKFYHDWYRTDLQAIAVVGDFDVDEVEKKVIKLFSLIPAVKNPKKRYYIEIPDKEKPTYVLATDKENTSTSLALYIRKKGEQEDNSLHSSMRNSLIRRLISSMFGGRMSELLETGTPPMISGALGYQTFPQTNMMFYISTTAKENEEELAFKTILQEAQRVKLHGFTESELARAKTSLEAGYKKALVKKGKVNHDSYCREMRDLYLKNIPMPGIDYEYEFVKKVLPTITTAEILTYFKSMWIDENRVIVVTGPKKDGIKHLTEHQCLEIIDEVENDNTLTAYFDNEISSSLISQDPVKGKIISTRLLPQFKAEEWTLSNNAKVVYRFADYNKNEVALKAYSKGGTSLYDLDMLPSAKMAPGFTGSFGVGQFTATQLKKALNGKVVNLSYSIAELSEGLDGNCQSEDFETLMQLTYMHFAEPRFDEEAYNTLKARNKAMMASFGDNPKKIMADSISMIKTNYNPRSATISQEYFDKVDFNKMKAAYLERFENAGDFIFFIVGDIEKEKAKLMVELYIGSLKSTDNVEDWIDRNVCGPEGITERTIPLEMVDEKATIKIYYNNELDYTPENRIGFIFLQQILKLRYTENIREKEGGTYGVGVGAAMVHYPTSEGKVSIGFDCDPERMEDLIPLVYKEIKYMMKKGASTADIEKTRKTMLKGRAENMQKNNFWLSSIYNHYVHNSALVASDDFVRIMNEVDAKMIKNLAKKYFKDADRIEFRFIPE